MTRVLRLVVWVGGIALLAATLVDTLAVVGRHVALPIHGSIEMMQAVVLISGVLAMLVATIENSHARVKLAIDRLSPRRRAVMDWLSNLLTLLFFLALLAGSSWIAWDLRNAHEQSELLAIPWMALRAIAGLVLLATCGVLVARLVSGNRAEQASGDDAAEHGE